MGEAPERVAGLYLDLRLIQPGDAEYVYALRSNPAYNAHLSHVIGTAEDQRRWIETYKQREAEGREVYYIIERRTNGRPCGLVRLYGIEGDRFTWGSWILDAGKPAKAALESAVLVYDIGFGEFGANKAVFEVRRQNDRTLAFHRRFGAVETSTSETDIYFMLSREQFLADRLGHWRVIESSGQAS
jgi:RimJ/RimL family protein N-acetyltransferase